MLNKLETKIKNLVHDTAVEPQVTPDIENNPLVGYLRIYQNQHKIISILYRGLIVAFSGFVLLLSFLIFNILTNDLIPLWGAFGLGMIDVFLFAGVFKAVQELNKYKKKSSKVLDQVYEYLKNDLSKLEKIKVEHAFISNTHKKIQKKIKLLSGDTTVPKIEEYHGWDSQTCPSCHTSMDMLIEVCPNCSHILGKMHEN
ncbi:MAG: hypothetical protein GY866_04305 [Proteobacteria bacterium]|nr:hypothetical protein [Pseudomonadota bacterium]